jgi:hypothetical protein
MSVRNSIILTSCVVGCALALTLSEPARAIAQGAAKALIVSIDQSAPGASNGVYVNNAPNVTATISGTPSVNATINGTPTVNVGNSAIAVTLPATTVFQTQLLPAEDNSASWVNDSGKLVVIEYINASTCGANNYVTVFARNNFLLFRGMSVGSSGCFAISELTKLYVSPGDEIIAFGNTTPSTRVVLVGHYEQ